MKRLIALVIAAIMVLSLIPTMVLPAVAEEEAEYAYPDPLDGFWSIYRSPGSYKVPDPDDEEEKTYTPAPAYRYTAEGFQITSADYTNMTPKWTVQTSRSQDLEAGFYMQFRVDEYSYRGENGAADAWIAFTIADSRLIEPGTINHNNYLCVLLRGNGDGQVAFNETAIGTKTVEDKKGSFNIVTGGTSATVPMDEDGKEIYDIELVWDGTDYIVYICGVAIKNSQITAHLKSFEECYVGVTMMSTVKDGKASMTILKTGTSAADATVPEGTDEAEAEENTLVYGDPIDPTTVPENEPALLFNPQTLTSNPSPAGATFTPTANYTYHVTVTAPPYFFQWGPRNAITYMAEDFPVFAMMLKDYYGPESGGMYYNAGDIMSANSDYHTSWNLYDEYSTFYGDDDEYSYVIVDLTDMWEGRINSVRLDWTGDVGSEYYIEYMAFFRSPEEALAYGEAYVVKQGVDIEDSADETDAPTDDAGEDTDAPTAEGDTAADTQAPTAEGDTTVDDGDTAGGCASVVGFGSVAILAAAAAAVACKKKN